MSDDISRIVLEELREHRRDTKANFDKVFGRLGSIEQTRAKEEGSNEVKGRHFKYGVGLIAFVVTAATNAVIRMIP